MKRFTLKMTLTLSPRGSRFWKDSLRGTALELKKEHDYKRQRRDFTASDVRQIRLLSDQKSPDLTRDLQRMKQGQLSHLCQESDS